MSEQPFALSAPTGAGDIFNSRPGYVYVPGPAEEVVIGWGLAMHGDGEIPPEPTTPYPGATTFPGPSTFPGG